jgi:hypothetical protein
MLTFSHVSVPAGCTPELFAVISEAMGQDGHTRRLSDVLGRQDPIQQRERARQGRRLIPPPSSHLPPVRPGA